MSLFGECQWCPRTTQLRYKPDRPADEQTRPTICHECYWEVKESMREARRVPPHVDPVPEEYR